MYGPQPADAARHAPGVALRMMRRLRAAAGPLIGTSSVILLAQVLYVAFALVTARLLLPAGKGQVTAVLAWTQVLAFLGTCGMNVSLGRRVAMHAEEELGTIIGNAVLFSVTVGLALGAPFLYILPALLNVGDVQAIIKLALLSLPLQIAQVLMLAIQINVGAVRTYRVGLLAGPIAGLLWLLGVLSIGDAPLEVFDVALATVAGSVAAGLASAYGLPWPRARINLHHLRRDARYGFKAASSSLVGLLNIRADLLLLSVASSSTTVGLYSAANNVLGPTTAISAATAAHLAPTAARAKPPVGGLILNEARRAVILTAIPTFALVAALPVLVPTALGDAYRATVPLAMILSLGYVARAYSSVASAGATAAGRPRIAVYGELCALSSTLALLYPALKAFGATGAAVVSVLTYSLSAGFLRYLIRRGAI